MSQATVAEPATRQGPLELSRIQMNVVFVTAGYVTRGGDGVLLLTERGQAEMGKVTAAWKAWLMGELRDWLEEHHVSSEQRQQVADALDRITLRLVREADAEARRTGIPSARRAMQAGTGTA
jgi:hypothetical protein